MKRMIYLLLLSFAFASQACRLTASTATPTPAILADSFFSGRAFQDSNGSGVLDDGDQPLAGARFTAMGFGAETDKSGYATIVIPGGWDQPLQARMAAPPDCGCSLIGPSEVTLQSSGQTRADFLFTAAAILPATPSAAPPSPAGAGPGSGQPTGTDQNDIPYCTTADGVALKMDLRYPQSFNPPAPLVTYVHGGGWKSGDKSEGAGTRFFTALLEQGYIIAAINYRLAPDNIFPAQIEDVRCAVRHLRANAAQYGLDPERIAAMGGSAGGHLVALLGTSGDRPGWPEERYQEDYAGQSSAVQAVVDLFGPADLAGGYNIQSVAATLRPVFGDDPAALATFSPVTYITSAAPPFLILHGDQDRLVPLRQSQILQERLSAAGVPAELVVVKNAGHGFAPSGGRPDPDIEQLAETIIAFLSGIFQP